jgi:DNA invertase Pin-like site-specific DNA recombinase
MASLKPKPPFQVLVMSEESRLGRESTETFPALKQILAAGVRIFSYLEDREVLLGTLADNTMTFLRAEFAAEERRKAAQRTLDAMVRKARAGYVTGGKVFGYDNVRIAKGQVDRQINEAAIVRRIFTLYADGCGYRNIAHLLNEQGVPQPRALMGRPAGWDPGLERRYTPREINREGTRRSSSSECSSQSAP